MDGTKSKNGSFIASAIITLFIILMLVISGPIAEAVKVTLAADKSEVRAGDATENKITFTTWVNLSSPDRYVPMQRVFLNISGPISRSFSFDLNGSNILGTEFDDEITVDSDGDPLSDNYGSGYGYDFNTGGYYDFGYGYGYGYGTETGSWNRSYTITLNTSRMFDGNYTAITSVYTSGSTTHSFTSSSINFTVLPRIVTVQLPSLSPDTTNSSGIIETPTGSYEWIIVTNGTTIPVNLNVTIATEPPSAVTNITSALAGAIPDLYFTVNVSDENWYNNISHVQFRAYYNVSKVPADIDESTLRAYRYTSSEWKRLDCAALGGCDAILADGTILYAAGVNTESKFVYANLSHFSTFAVAGIEEDNTSSGGGSSGGGGGSSGGGGIITSEPFDNIDRAERYDKDLIVDIPVTYTFTVPEHGIYEVVVTGKENENSIAVRIEALKGTSRLVKSPTPGAVYKNMNILVGTKKIKEALIRFKVENSWLSRKNLTGSDIRMVRWNGSKWVQLETIRKTKDSTYTYYEAKTDGFSSFAISGAKGGAVIPKAATNVTAKGTPVTKITPEATSIDTTAIPPEDQPANYTWVYVLIAVVVVAAAVYFFVVKKGNK